MTIDINSRIYIAGHRGMVGSAIHRKLRSLGCRNLITRTHRELDLTCQETVRDFFRKEKIDHVVIAAARVGGIHANNTYPADFIYDNLMIAANLIHEAFGAGVRQLLFLGSSCIYPREAPQPMKESHLLTGPLEPTNEPYAVAKIAGIKLCESYNRQHNTAYRSAMPTNLYGPNDNYNLMNAHVLPAMIRKFHLAKCASQGRWDAIGKDETLYGSIPDEIRALLKTDPRTVLLWGTGTPRREFLHADDLASACTFIMGLSDAEYEKHTQPMLSHINVGTGQDIPIRELAELVQKIVGYTGKVIWDSTKPDGTPRKQMDVSLLENMGWRAGIPLEEGIAKTYAAYKAMAEHPALSDLSDDPLYRADALGNSADGRTAADHDLLL